MPVVNTASVPQYTSGVYHNGLRGHGIEPQTTAESHFGWYCALGALAVVGGAIFLNSDHPYARALRSDAKEAKKNIRHNAEHLRDNIKDAAHNVRRDADELKRDVVDEMNANRRF